MGKDEKGTGLDGSFKMGLLDADKIQRMEAFGDDICDLLEVIEKSFGVEFTDEELIAAETIGLLGACISHKLFTKSRTSSSSTTEVVSALRKLIAVEISMKAEKITEKTRFPEGLKIY